MSKLSPRISAAFLARLTSKFTPRDIFALKNTATLSERETSSAFCSSERPVVAITSGVLVRLQYDTTFSKLLG